MTDRSDVDFLLKAEPEEYDFFEALDAYLMLADSLDDISFQLNDVPRDDFSGSDYEKWRKGASFKRNKISSATRKFKFRVMLTFEAYKAKKQCG